MKKPKANSPVIQTNNVVKVYGAKDTAFTALDGISLTIDKGDTVAIVGKSGSGKSTLTHILALLDHPTKGSVTVNGIESSKLSNRQINKLRNQEFGFVFQQFFMNSRDTVINNVMLPLTIAGVKSSERKRRGLAALKTVELADKANVIANDLSGGQKQRVCIARAIVNNPSVIFADEPTGNLDSATGSVVEKLLFDLNKNKGITLVIVTHDPDLAAKCHRQIHISDGRIIDDTTKSLAKSKAKGAK